MKITTTFGALIGVLTLNALLIATPASAAEKFYKWTDEKGVTHYSIDPPPKEVGNASSVKISTKHSAVTGADDTESAGSEKASAGGKENKDGKDAKSDKEKTSAAKSDKKAPDQYADKCKQLQSNLQVLKDHGQAREKNEKGEIVVLDDTEKQNRLDDTQRQMKAFCQ